MTSLLERIVGRQPFEAVDGRTGATFETGTLDGDPVVLKHVRPDDWVMVASGGRCALAELWATGAFDRVPGSIEHAMLSVEAARDGSFVIVMRDVSPHLFVEGRVLSRDENRSVLRAADDLHRSFRGTDAGGFSLAEMYDVFTLPRARAVLHLPTPIPGLILRGWERFADVAPADVAEPMLALVGDPSPLVAELSRCEMTFIHGDLRPHNMGLDGDRLVLLDWERAGTAPAAVELAWYLVIGASRIDASREQILEDYRSIAGDRFDPRAWDLACVGAVLSLGWNKVIDILDHPDERIRAQERADLDWWIERVRSAFEVWSPP